MKKNILISGVTGFVGDNLKSYLTGKYLIKGLSRVRSETQEIISYEDISVEEFDNSLAFLHLAGKAHDLKRVSNEKDYFKANAELTEKMFDQFLASDCEVFVYMSSVKAVADNVEGELEEDIVPNPITAYGKSKLAEKSCILSQELSKNKRVYILRPCMIHGPNNKGNLNLLYSFVSKGIPYPFGKYKNKRSFVSVENLCFLIKELIENKEIASGVYNIADDGFLSTNGLVQLIGEVIEKPSKILKLPKGIVKFIALIGDVLPLPINSERLHKLTENYVVSNAKIKKEINKELPLSLKEGLIRTIKSFT